MGMSEAILPRPQGLNSRGVDVSLLLARRVTSDGLPVHSFRTLVADLATLARNTIITAVAPNLPLTVFTRPTPVQQRAFELLEVAL
jgi:hypothetical protein